MSNFDSLINSSLQVIRIITLNNWTYLMNNIYRTFNAFSFFYFISLVVIGNFFILNLILGVLKIKYSSYHKKIIEKNALQKKKYDLKKLKKQKIYIKRVIGDKKFIEIYVLNKRIFNKFKTGLIKLTKLFFKFFSKNLKTLFNNIFKIKNYEFIEYYKNYSKFKHSKKKLITFVFINF